ncbi:unnamed protein product [Peronospora farinosa]|uniref:Reverse transcriptase Ty1/copia-type domain-containing protein n=1 Tax=Peronospora farinosa TaxID=134698 RepID=A0AAV0SSD8_9STRA|nr:unnamed protein product [Peronospora farinosa]
MLWSSGMQTKFWGDAILYASTMRNYLPTRGNADRRSPLEVLTGKLPDVSHLLKFGARCTVRLEHAVAKSLRKRSEQAFILGIDPVNNGYNLYLPRTKTYLTSSNIQNVDHVDIDAAGDLVDTFDTLDAVPSTFHPQAQQMSDRAATTDALHKTTPVSEGEPSPDHLDWTSEVSGSDDDDDFKTGEPIDDVTLTKRQIDSVFEVHKRGAQLPIEEFELPASLLLDVTGISGAAMMALHISDGVPDPKNIREAMASPFWPQLKEAMIQELDQLCKNGTWEEAVPPPGAKVVSTRWVFKIKYNSMGELDKFKARLVKRGFTQRYGVDFSETYSPVLKMASARFLITLGAQWGCKVRHGDVPNAYLRAPIDRPIYVKPPHGSPDEGRVYRLLKSLYGLKQSGRLWNDLIHSFLLECGYTQSRQDPCVYFKHEAIGTTVVGLYVDDVIIIAQDDSLSETLMQQLYDKFDINDLGLISKFLGINVDTTDYGYFLQQQHNIDALLTRLEMNCTTRSTPKEEKHKLYDPNSSLFSNKRLYQEVMGSLLWISNCTRPDITTTVNLLCRATHAPTTEHWSCVKRLMRYLKGTSTHGIFIKKLNSVQSQPRLKFYSDASWADSKLDAKSTTGVLLTMNGSPISWYSKKQSVVALSTMEAEYIAGATGVSECLWVKDLLS